MKIKSYADGSIGTRELDAGVFGERVLGRTLKEAVVMYEANRRQGTHKAKTRSEVKGPNRKLWKQKHTGRARMGSTKSPIWTGGGVAFPPVPRDYSYHMPKKARRVALFTAIFGKLRDGEVAVAEGFPTDKPSTKQAFAVLKALDMTRSVTVVTDGLDRNLWLSLRNVPGVKVMPAADLNAHDVTVRRFMVCTPPALESLAARAKAFVDAKRPRQES
ncbi:MAG TPA: 50S ribosomal protein L4 [Planctomycetota bacterium]|nr:50S ribosomal protein L4 [Planctomycetota bacterium]